MLVEAPIFRGEHGLDQMIGKLVELERIVVADAARADFVAVAVQEGDGELRFLQPVIFRRLAERRQGEGQHEHEAAASKGQPLRYRLDQGPAPPAADMEAVHEDGVALVELAPPGACEVEAEIDARVEIEHDPARARLPVLRILIVLKQVAQHHQSLRPNRTLSRSVRAALLPRGHLGAKIEPCGPFKLRSRRPKGYLRKALDWDPKMTGGPTRLPL